MIFAFFSCSRTRFELRNLLPLLEFLDLLCSFLPHRRLLLIVGDFWAFFRSRESPADCRRPLSPAMSDSATGKFWGIILVALG
ncbi:hypothetical protein SLEP1_g42452 [Rubroshorea leprosula]|uniref:Uncharacterized protein n=1 Tax=Rubroshorea leprosula TaxID=152421 RepID=A0AAV5LAI2_9ROSI|nr:hypothetical protein SLEP1_g42452 [Rubroshorea leprosula]